MTRPLARDPVKMTQTLVARDWTVWAAYEEVKSKCGRKESDCSLVVLVPVNNFLFCGHFRDHGPLWWRVRVTTAHSQHVRAGLSAAPTSVTVSMSRHFLSSALDPVACWEQPQNWR